MKPGDGEAQHDQPHASVGGFDKPGLNRKRLMIISAVVAVVLVGGLATWRLVTNEKQPTAAVTTQQDKQYTNSKADLEQQLKSAKTPTEKSAAYQGLANLENESGNKQAAEQQAELAVKSDASSYEAYAVLAMTKMQNGDNAGAIAAYQKAAELARAAGNDLGARDYEVMAASVGK